MKDSKGFLTVTKKVKSNEILKDNFLEKEINKTKKKITIQHYLNIYLRNVEPDSDQEDKYPLYVRVIFNRQSIKVKSAINVAYSKTEFKNLDLEMKNLIERESLTLTHFVSTNYLETMNYIAESLEYADQSLYSFSVIKLFENYSYQNLTIPYLLNKSLIKEIGEFAELNSLDSYLNLVLVDTDNLNAFQYFQFLVTRESKWKKFSKSYKNGIWFFAFHYMMFLNENEKYSRLGASIVDLLHLDFRNSFNDFLQINKLDYTVDDLKIISGKDK
jgi:hypothetical protein